MIEPMIEPIFVILGILASVAIPRLAATREDAEISAAVANLRTLVSDASAYYTVKGTLGTSPNFAKWNEITNVPLLQNASGAAIGTTAATVTAYLKVGDVKNCIDVQLVEKVGTTPAYIKITKNSTNKNKGICKQVLESDPLKPYFTSTVNGARNIVSGTSGAIAIGSNTKIY